MQLTEKHKEYWRKNLTITAILLFVWFVITFVIGYYARVIAKEVKLPSQFAALAPKVSEFFAHKAFGKTVNLEDAAAIHAMNSNVAQYVCVQTFKKALLDKTIAEQEPELHTAPRLLSSMEPMPWSRKGQQTEEVSYKYHAARTWCENATTLTGIQWRYLKIMLKAFENLRPEVFADLLELIAIND